MIICDMAQPEVQQLFCIETRLRQDDATVDDDDDDGHDDTNDDHNDDNDGHDDDEMEGGGDHDNYRCGATSSPQNFSAQTQY